MDEVENYENLVFNPTVHGREVGVALRKRLFTLGGMITEAITRFINTRTGDTDQARIETLQPIADVIAKGPEGLCEAIVQGEEARRRLAELTAENEKLRSENEELRVSRIRTLAGVLPSGDSSDGGMVPTKDLNHLELEIIALARRLGLPMTRVHLEKIDRTGHGEGWMQVINNLLDEPDPIKLSSSSKFMVHLSDGTVGLTPDGTMTTSEARERDKTIYGSMAQRLEAANKERDEAVAKFKAAIDPKVEDSLANRYAKAQERLKNRPHTWDEINSAFQPLADMIYPPGVAVRKEKLRPLAEAFDKAMGISRNGGGDSDTDTD